MPTKGTHLNVRHLAENRVSAHPRKYVSIVAVLTYPLQPRQAASDIHRNNGTTEDGIANSIPPPFMSPLRERADAL